MTGRLAGKVAVITGAGRGIGRAIATRFAGEGARVVAVDLDADAAVATAGLCGPDALSFQLDVADEVAVGEVVAEVIRQCGRVDVLINNAGITAVGSVGDVSVRAWDRAFDVNTRGVFLMMRAVWGPMLAQGGGAIINAGSVAGLEGVPQNVAYCASKAAVVLLSRAAALDGAPHGVRVNSVCPGFVDSPMSSDFFNEQADPEAARAAAVSAHPIGRLGEPNDIANAYLYLASDDASWVTGTTLVVDGGLTAGL